MTITQRLHYVKVILCVITRQEVEYTPRQLSLHDMQSYRRRVYDDYETKKVFIWLLHETLSALSWIKWALMPSSKRPYDIYTIILNNIKLSLKRLHNDINVCWELSMFGFQKHRFKKRCVGLTNKFCISHFYNIQGRGLPLLLLFSPGYYIFDKTNHGWDYCILICVPSRAPRTRGKRDIL